MAVRPNRRLIGTELEFSVAVFFFNNVQKYFSGPLGRGRSPPSPPMDLPLTGSRINVDDLAKVTLATEISRWPVSRKYSI